MKPEREMAIIKEWAQSRLKAGEEPPWSYYRLMQVIDAIDALAGNTGIVETVETTEEDNVVRIKRTAVDARPPA